MRDCLEEILRIIFLLYLIKQLIIIIYVKLSSINEKIATENWHQIIK